jgi:hypothetical protein
VLTHCEVLDWKPVCAGSLRLEPSRQVRPSRSALLMVVAAAEVVGGAVVVVPPTGTSVAVVDVVVVSMEVPVVVLAGAVVFEDDVGRGVPVRVRSPSPSRRLEVVLPTGTTTAEVVALPSPELPPPGAVGAPGGLASG